MKNLYNHARLIALITMIISITSCGNSKKGMIFFSEDDILKVTDKSELETKAKKEFSKDVSQIYFMIYPKYDNTGKVKIILNSPKGDMTFNEDLEINPTWEVYGTTINITPKMKENLGEYNLQIFDKPKEGEKPRLLGEGNFILKSESGSTSNSKTNSSTTSTDDLKKKELELKEKELNMKEEELNRQKANDNNRNNTGISGKYPEGSTRTLTPSDVQGMSKYELKIMRNEIFARHGYIFKTDDMKNYFLRQSWYVPLYENVDNRLSALEKSNVDLIKSYEK